MTQDTTLTHKMQLIDWLDDLCVRFIINLPHEELESVARICFQVEEAQWFYEDFIRPIDPTLPSLHLKDFCLAIFRHCPLLSSFSGSQHLAAYQEFLGYKTRVPVRGAILLNHDMDQVLLVKGWKKNASWSFPRGKINKDEKDLDCAIREVYEETGYDVNAAGLVTDPDEVKAIDVTMREQHIRLFVFRNVPQTTQFAPRTRKEISKIDWYKLNDLPTFRKGRGADDDVGQMQVNANKFYMVAPFLGPLKKWIKQQHKLEAHQAKYGDLGEITEDGFAADASHDPAANTLTHPHTHSQMQQAPPRSIESDTLQLKQLLNIGNPVAPPVISSQEKDSHAQRLLAALRGPFVADTVQAPGVLSQPVHTPYEQIQAFPPEPRSPHPHRPIAHQMAQQPPDFGINLSQQHQVVPLTHQPLRQAIRTPSESRTDSAQTIHQPVGRTGPIDPATIHPDQTAPEASQLPIPNLNGHTMSLLNTFKSRPASAAPPVHPVSQQQTPNPHQASLLDLFRRPSVPSVDPQPRRDQDRRTSIEEGTAQTSSAPTMSDTAVSNAPSRPGEQRRKSSAYSMYTRTLPKQKSTPPVPPMPQAHITKVASLTTVAPSSTEKESVSTIRTETQTKAILQPSRSPEITILQRPKSAVPKSAVPKHVGTAATAASSPPKQITSGKRAEARSQPVMQILSRPGSATPSASASADASERPGKATYKAAQPRVSQPFQPQVLKRPGSIAPGGLSSDTVTGRGEDKRNALLALFSSEPARSDAAGPGESRHGPVDKADPKAGASGGIARGPRDLRIGGGGHQTQTRHSVPNTQESAASALLGALSAQRASVSGSSFALASPTSASGRSVVNTSGLAGKFSEGTRSPESPAEAKDFLLGFLKGVK